MDASFAKRHKPIYSVTKTATVQIELPQFFLFNYIER